MRRYFLAAVLPLAALLAHAQETTVKQETEVKKEAEVKQETKDEKKKKDQFRMNSTNAGGMGGAPRDGKTFPERLIGPLGKDLNAYGNWVLTLRSNQVTGSQSAKDWFKFQNNNQFFNTSSLGPFQQQLDLTLMGSLFSAVRVNTSLTNNRVAAQTSLAQLLGFEYESADKRTKAAVGDVNASLPGNELVTFSRRLVGVQYDRQLGAGRTFSTVASITRALARRGSFQGNGTTGPYYMNASQIIPSSEKLYLNGQELIAYEDYELDYILGTVHMKKSRILNREDTVEFSYEAQNFNTSPGVLTGLRFETPASFAKSGRVGATVLRQMAGSSGTANRPVTQYFPVYSDLASRYTLPSPIQPNTPVEVRYQERLLTEGINADYILNRELNYIQLRRSLPADTALLGISSLSINYTPVPQLGVGGDRQVLGLDTQFSPLPNAKINVQYGQSQGISKQNSGTGLIFTAALGSQLTDSKSAVMMGTKDTDALLKSTSAATGSGFRPSWNANLGWRNIEPGFSGIESTATALLRSERGLRGTFGFSPSPSWAYDFTVNDTTVSQPLSSSVGTTTTGSSLTTFRNQTMNFGANWTPPTQGKQKLPRMRYSHAGTNQGSGNSLATFNSDQLAATYDLAKGSVEASLFRTGSKGRSIFANGYTQTVGTGASGGTGGLLGGYRDGTTAQTTTNSSSETAQLKLNLTPGANLTFSTSVGLTSNRSGGGLFRGRDLAFSTTYSPLPEKLQLQVDVTDTTNGQNLSGFFNAGSGLDSGNTGLGGASTGQRTRSQNARVSFTPTPRFRVETGFIQQLSLIPGYDNTESKTTDLSLDYTLNEKFKLLGQWSKQGTTYVGSTSDSDNQNYILQVMAGPYRRMNFTVSGARMNFGTALSNFGTGGGIVSGIGSGLGQVGGGVSSGFGQSGVTTTFVLRSTYAVSLQQRAKGESKEGTSRETPLLPFLEWRLLNASSPAATGTGTGTGTGSGTGSIGGFHNALNYLNNEARVGIEWAVSSLLSATFDVRFIRMTDRDTPQFSYNARTLNFDLRARFN
ncbi:hypothetical protein [Armatimonas sp.]|uniref:hypothetical protein n=1 Tax=Armatimonas sp. TaxID=1872638 RepID=UPI00286D2460|nr:hypothetical protein [Armatimonas sp.]